MFAKVMGELMFWLGEDRVIFGSDYAIWEPKWQVEGFAAWEMPAGDEFSDYGPLSPEPRRRSSGSMPPGSTTSRYQPTDDPRR